MMKALLILMTLQLLCCNAKLYACACSEKKEMQLAIKESVLILKGRVIHIDEVNIIFKYPLQVFNPDSLVYSQSNYKGGLSENIIVVESVFKGDVFEDTIKIYSSLSPGSCGYHFLKGEDYLIYITKESYEDNKGKAIEILFTDTCTRNCLFNKKEEQLLLDELSQNK